MKKHLFALCSKPGVKVDSILKTLINEIESLSEMDLNEINFNTIWNQKYVFKKQIAAEQAKKLIYINHPKFYESFTIELIESV